MKLCRMQKNSLKKEDFQKKYGIGNSQIAIVEAFCKRLFDQLKTLSPQPAKSPEFYVNMDSCCRFLIAREFDQSKAQEMLLNWIKWYDSFRPDLLKKEDFKQLYATGKVRNIGKDRNGYPIMYLRMRYTTKTSSDAQTNLRFMIMMVEDLVNQAEKSGVSKISVVHDRMGDYQKDEESAQAMKKFSPILNDNYPERLGFYYMVGMNWFMRVAFKVVGVFLPKRTTQKVRVLAGIDQLSEHISQENLLDEYGGQLKIKDCERRIHFKESKLSKEQVQALRAELK